MPIQAEVLAIMRCPACRAEVRALPGDAGIACQGCRRVYPIVDGIASMLVESGKIPPA